MTAADGQETTAVAGEELAAAALSYIERGWAPIPLWPIVDGRCACPDENCTDAGKHPRVKWRDADLTCSPLPR